MRNAERIDLNARLVAERQQQVTECNLLDLFKYDPLSSINLSLEKCQQTIKDNLKTIQAHRELATDNAYRLTTADIAELLCNIALDLTRNLHIENIEEEPLTYKQFFIEYLTSIVYNFYDNNLVYRCNISKELLIHKLYLITFFYNSNLIDVALNLTSLLMNSSSILNDLICQNSNITHLEFNHI